MAWSDAHSDQHVTLVTDQRNQGLSLYRVLRHKDRHFSSITKGGSRHQFCYRLGDSRIHVF